ncbi:MAG: hypothetical protein AAGG48_29680 [Planctomycetota bacterium]
MCRFKGYPRSLKTKSIQGEQEWTIANNLYARTDLPSESPVADEVVRIDQETAICQPSGDVEMSEKTEESQTPVYRLGDNGPVGVPTGLIFIRFDKATSLDERREQLEELGFEVANEADTAEGGWVRHKSGSCEASLSNAARLHEVEGVRVVEPQFLLPRQSKSSRGPMGRP